METKTLSINAAQPLLIPSQRIKDAVFAIRTAAANRVYILNEQSDRLDLVSDFELPARTKAVYIDADDQIILRSGAGNSSRVLSSQELSVEFPFPKTLASIRPDSPIFDSVRQLVAQNLIWDSSHGLVILRHEGRNAELWVIGDEPALLHTFREVSRYGAGYMKDSRSLLVVHGESGKDQISVVSTDPFSVENMEELHWILGLRIDLNVSADSKQFVYADGIICFRQVNVFACYGRDGSTMEIERIDGYEADYRGRRRSESEYQRILADPQVLFAEGESAPATVAMGAQIAPWDSQRIAIVDAPYGRVILVGSRDAVVTTTGEE